VAYGVLAALLGMVLGVVTCCIGLLPIVHQTLMAPYYFFERSHTLHMLASLGPEFDLLTEPNAPDPNYGWGAPPGPSATGVPPVGGFGG
jgi:hypothetical protein